MTEPDYTYADAAALLRISEDKLRRITPTGLPHLKIGRDVRFTVEHIAQIRAMKEIRPTDGPDDKPTSLRPATRRRTS